MRSLISSTQSCVSVSAAQSHCFSFKNAFFSRSEMAGAFLTGVPEGCRFRDVTVWGVNCAHLGLAAH